MCVQSIKCEYANFSKNIHIRMTQSPADGKNKKNPCSVKRVEFPCRIDGRMKSHE